MQGFSSAAGESADVNATATNAASVRTAAWAPPSGTLGALTRSAHERAHAVAATITELRSISRALPSPPAFGTALRGNMLRVIAEVKRASPSKGVIAPGLDAAQQARHYVQGGAAAISVLTEPDRFGGALSDLRAVTAAVSGAPCSVPAIRKDFIVHPVQIWEARACGAAAALLIVRSLAPGELERLMDEATLAGIETLVEVRDECELERALNARAAVIGVNNRNLETLEIDVTNAPRIIALIPVHIVAVAESGMRTVDDLAAPARAGADAVLIGSAISADADPELAVRALASVPRVGRV